jgi:hypothetical protein
MKDRTVLEIALRVYMMAAACVSAALICNALSLRDDGVAFLVSFAIGALWQLPVPALVRALAR